jgi:hypothetical protein
MQRASGSISAAEAIASFVIDVEAARQTTWEFLTAPGHRVMWTAGATGVEEDVANGRRGAGTVNHCMHGKDVIIEEVLDWQPPDYLTRRIQSFDTGVNLTLTHALSDGPSGGTRIEVRVAPPPPELMERFVQIEADDAAIDAGFRRSVGEAAERGRGAHPRRHGLGSGGAGLGRAFRDPAGS